MMGVEPKFIVDTMLGNIARWLRLLGYDTIYKKDLKDWVILRIATNESRVIITLDRSLHNRALNRGLFSVYLNQRSVGEKLAYLSYVTGIKLYVELDRARCSMCNNELTKVSKNMVKDRVPPNVYRLYEDFWICRKCGKVYWIGSHWRMIEQILKQAREIVDEYRLKKMV